MDIQALKIQLVKDILHSESKELLDQVYSILHNDIQDPWLELDENQQYEIKLAQEQADKGQVEDWSSVYDKMSKKKK